MKVGNKKRIEEYEGELQRERDGREESTERAGKVSRKIE